MSSAPGMAGMGLGGNNTGNGNGNGGGGSGGVADGAGMGSPISGGLMGDKAAKGQGVLRRLSLSGSGFVRVSLIPPIPTQTHQS